jgi:hypothetical protein
MRVLYNVIDSSNSRITKQETENVGILFGNGCNSGDPFLNGILKDSVGGIFISRSFGS